MASEVGYWEEGKCSNVYFFKKKKQFGKRITYPLY